MRQPLIDDLLRLAVAELLGGSRADAEALRRGLASLTREEAVRLRFSADANRFLPALGFVLASPSLAGTAPAILAQPAEAAHRMNRLRNRVILVMAQRVQKALEQAGEQPILFKGIHYLDWLWPDAGARRLQDLDLVMPGADIGRCCAALRPLGFEAIEEPPSDAIHLRHAMGLEIDLHHRFRLFETLPEEQRVEAYESRLLPGPPWRVFAPEFELATLIHHHCSDHVEAEGTRLCWIADLALRLREARTERPDRVFELVADPRRLERAAWIVSIIESDLGIPLPRWSAALPRPAGSADWPTAMASTRMLPMGIPSMRGWARFIASGAARWRDRWGPRPTMADLSRLPEVVRSISGRRRRGSPAAFAPRPPHS